MAVRKQMDEEEIREEVRKRYANMATKQSEVGWVGSV